MGKLLKVRNRLGLELAVNVVGKGEPVLCICGFASSRNNFSLLSESLKENNQLIMLDNRGMGDSDSSKTSYSIDDLAQDAADVMKSLGHKSYHVIGISMGGFIGQRVAINLGQKILSLSLLCTSSGGHGFIPLPLATEKSLERFYTIDEPQRSTKALEFVLHPSFSIRKPEVYKDIMKIRQEFDVRVDQVLLQKRAVDNFMKEAQPLHEITIPTLILTGANDRYVDPNNSFLLGKRIKNSKVFQVERTDHLFFFEENEVVSGLLNSFLTENKIHTNIIGENL